jgi:NADPH-dependent curcumin reductase CurA
MRSRKRIMGKSFGMTGFINLDEYDKSISELIKELTGRWQNGCGLLL